MPVVYLVRHAACRSLGPWLAGHSPDVHLDAAGEAQAKALGRRFASTPLDAVYTSPLERARETAAWIARGRGMEPRVLEEMEEIRFGEWTGRSFEELEGRADWRRFNRFRATTRAPGGETMAEVQARALRGVERVAAAHARAVVVSHGDVIKAALCGHLGLPLDLLERLEISAGSVSRLRIEPGASRLERLNDTGEEAP